MISRRSVRRFVTFTMVALVVGCNAIVGNDPGTLKQTTLDGADAGSRRDVAVSASRPPITCASNEKVCVGACVPNLNTGFGCANAASCDPCPQPAHATPVCTGTGCGVTCKAGYENCDTAPDCETDITQATSCGGCKVNCGAKYCSPTGSTFGCTDSCAAPLVPCGMQCVDIDTSKTSCGSCNHACAEPAHSTATCTKATCGFTCDPGFHECNGACVSTLDVTTCGASCRPCGAPPPNMTMACTNGTCAATCKPGWGDCDGNADNGCEADLVNDAANCGKCGNACLGGPALPPASLSTTTTCCTDSLCGDCLLK